MIYREEFELKNINKNFINLDHLIEVLEELVSELFIDLGYKVVNVEVYEPYLIDAAWTDDGFPRMDWEFCVQLPDVELDSVMSRKPYMVPHLICGKLRVKVSFSNENVSINDLSGKIIDLKIRVLYERP